MLWFDEFSWLLWILLSVIVVIAGLIHGTLGIGFPMVATPLIALFIDVRGAIMMLLLPTLCINVANILKGGNWQNSIGRYWGLALFGVVGSIVGTRLLVVTDPAPYRILLAGAILGYLNVDRLGWRMAWIRRKPWMASVVFGFGGGFLAGTVNVMLPALIVFALEMGLTPMAMIQTFNFCFLTGKLAQGITLAVSGVLGGYTLITTLPLALVGLVAMGVGMRLRDRISAESYRKWLRKALYGIALMLMVQFFLEIMR